MRAALMTETRELNFINAALLLLAGALVVAGACRAAPELPTIDGATIWTDTVKRGDFVQEVRGAGQLDAVPGGGWRAVLRIGSRRP